MVEDITLISTIIMISQINSIRIIIIIFSIDIITSIKLRIRMSVRVTDSIFREGLLKRTMGAEWTDYHLIRLVNHFRRLGPEASREAIPEVLSAPGELPIWQEEELSGASTQLTLSVDR